MLAANALHELLLQHLDGAQGDLEAHNKQVQARRQAKQAAAAAKAAARAQAKAKAGKPKAMGKKASKAQAADLSAGGGSDVAAVGDQAGPGPGSMATAGSSTSLLGMSLRGMMSLRGRPSSARPSEGASVRGGNKNSGMTTRWVEDWAGSGLRMLVQST